MIEFTVIDGVCPELVPALRDSILYMSAHERTHGSNNVGGWKSDIDFFGPNAPDPHHLLLDQIAEHVDGASLIAGTLVGWAMVNRAGSYHKRHTHGLRYTCGVYYVSAGEPAVPTIFETPADGQAAHETAVAPTPGRLVLFPGHLFHRVPIYDGDEPRITIAFEVRP